MGSFNPSLTRTCIRTVPKTDALASSHSIGVTSEGFHRSSIHFQIQHNDHLPAVSCSFTQPPSEAQEWIPLSDAVITEAIDNAYSAKAKASVDPASFGYT